MTSYPASYTPCPSVFAADAAWGSDASVFNFAFNVNPFQSTRPLPAKEPTPGSVKQVKLCGWSVRSRERFAVRERGGTQKRQLVVLYAYA